MGREVRMVPSDWEHPKDEKGAYIPLYPFDFEESWKTWRDHDLPRWIEGAEKWKAGLIPDYDTQGGWKSREGLMGRSGEPVKTYRDWAGDAPQPPDPSWYMPTFPQGAADHFMMYEDTSEGTPISPAFKTAEELARWLVDNNASAWGSQTADYDWWLRAITDKTFFTGLILTIPA